MSNQILAIDQGTSSSRAILFDDQANILTTSQLDFTQHYPNPGWVEHDAMEIWQSQLQCINQVLKAPETDISAIKAIGITNQRETTLLWNRSTGEVVGPAIVWQDRRTADYCNQLREQGHAETFHQKTGLVLDAYFSGTKITWLLDNIPNARQQAERGELAFGTIDSWLIWQLTEGKTHVTDISNASRTLCCNIHTQQWDQALLDILNIPASLLPEIVPSSGRIAISSANVIGHELPISGIAGDQQSATFGQACYKPGMAKNTYGTGCFLLMNTGNEVTLSGNKLLSTIGWSLSRSNDEKSTQYMLEGGVFMGGATIQWLRDGMGLVRQASDIEALANTVDDNGQVYFVPAMTGLGAPYWDATARGMLLGLTRGSERGHIARAALEAIALQSYDLINAMNQDSEVDIQELRVDGGASQNNLLMQIQADILAKPVVRPKITETTALGAAYLAGLAEGVWSSPEEIAELWQVDRVFEPQRSAEWRESLITTWHKAVSRAQNWADL